MNSLQQELNNINQQLEHLTFRKNQLEPIIAEYNDTLERVKRLTDNMIALNIEPTNLRFDIEDILEGNAPGWGKWCSEPETTPEPTPQPGQDFPSDWMQVTEEAHSSEPTETEQATESEEQPEDYDSFYPELTPEPTRQPVRLMAFVPTFLTQEPTPEPTPAPSYCPRCLGTGIINKLIPEPVTPDPDYDQWDVAAVPCPECTPKPEPDLEECSKCEGEGVIESSLEDDQICPTCGGTGEKPELEPLTQLNLQAYKRGSDVLVIGFTNKRLLNTWSKWFKTTWSDTVHISDHSDYLQGFNHVLTVLWYGSPNWERLTKLNYSLKPTEQNAIAYHQQQTANSEEE